MRADSGTATPPAGGAEASRTVAVTVSVGMAVVFESVTLCTSATYGRTASDAARVWPEASARTSIVRSASVRAVSMRTATAV